MQPNIKLSLKAIARGAIIVLTCFGAATGYAAGTAAGTDIVNVAQVDYELGGTPVSQASNAVTITVDEIVDVTNVLQSPQQTVAPGETGAVLAFTVSNTGNGSETFILSVINNDAADDFDPTLQTPGVFFDSDGSGDLSAADTPYASGTNDPVLAPDAVLLVFVVNDIPAGLVNGQLGRSTLRVESATGTGTPGTVFPGLGDGGADALVGSSGGAAEATGEYLVSDVDVAINKAAVVTDAFGGSAPTPGALVTYTLTVTVTGTGTAIAAVINDPIPASTTYVPDSLTLNGASLSDVDDADAGSFISTPPNGAVSVSLGDLTQADGLQTITFSVRID
ncbi:MAG: hypothetical protein AAFR91_04425 [Pseudomonadota bacterium]